MGKLLLVSSSRAFGTGYLEHCLDAIGDHFAELEQVLFVPYALADHEKYEATVARAFADIGIGVVSLHRADDPIPAVAKANGIFIGGGNSFRLLKSLYDLSLLDPIREAVARGVAYMGSSAGTNMACPTIRTTNDMPIVEPPSLSALNLIPFQINPHYLDADPSTTHQGETRAQRLAEYHQENSTPVVALREGSWLEIDDNRCTLKGKTGMVLFQQYLEPQETATETNLSHLLRI